MTKKTESQILVAGPMFPNILIRNGGTMPSSSVEEMNRSCAAWYIAKLCHKALNDVPEQVTMEGDTDTTVNLRRIAEGAALAYGIEDLNLVMPYMPYVRMMAFRQGISWNQRFQAWLDSGGRAYDEVTREPEALNRS